MFNMLCVYRKIFLLSAICCLNYTFTEFQNHKQNERYQAFGTVYTRTLEFHCIVDKLMRVSIILWPSSNVIHTRMSRLADNMHDNKWTFE